MRNQHIVNSHLVIWLMMVVTFLWGITTISGKPPAIVKMVFAAALWTVVVLFPYHNIRRNDMCRFGNVLLRFVIALTALAVVLGALDTTSGHSGNKWLTMFGNDECMFMLLAPCFMYLSASPASLIVLKKASQVMLVLGALSIVIGKYVGGGLLWFIPLMLPYMKKKYWLLVMVAFGGAVYNAFYAENTSRSTILVLLILIIAYGCVYVLKSRKMIWMVCMTMIFLPLIYSAMMLINTEYSIVQVILDVVFQNTGDEQMSTDTRSFLFWELSEDLTRNNAWFFGKGAYSHYFSSFFSTSTSENADVGDRLGVEVTLLQLLLRSGITYVVVYYTLITTAVVTALKNSRNRFLLSFAIVASGWSLFSCISYLNGCRYMHLGFFLFLGCCMSKRWLIYTDADIKDMLKQ